MTLGRRGGICEEAGESEEVGGSAKRQGTLQRSGALLRSRGLCKEEGGGGALRRIGGLYDGVWESAMCGFILLPNKILSLLVLLHLDG